MAATITNAQRDPVIFYLGSDPKPVESEKEMTLSKKPVEHFGLSPTNNLPSLRDKRGEVSLTKHPD